MRETAFVSMGSNISPAKNMRKAVRILSERTCLLGISTVYCTRPEGPSGQPFYLNCIAALETDLSPHKLKYGLLRPIEEALGRIRNDDKYAPRTIDLDLVAYGGLSIKTEGLTLPDPLITERAFLAAGLYELSPEMGLPGLGISLKELAAGPRPEGMEPLETFTALLRKRSRLCRPAPKR